MAQDRTHRDRGPSQRQLRVGESIRHAIAQMLERGEVRDPALAGLLVTVTEARASPDLKSATVYIMPLGGIGAEIVLEALARAAPYLRGRVARELGLRFAPELRFEFDRSFEEAGRIETLLRSPEVARDLKNRDDEDEDDGA